MGSAFTFLNYSKEGPGVDKNAPKKRGFFIFWELYFRKFFKICGISALYIIFCLPVVTIGPATAGFTYVMRNFAREQHVFLWSDFISVIKKNFKQSFIAGLIDIFLLIVAICNYMVYSGLAQKYDSAYLAVGFISIVFLVYFVMRFYIYTLIITFDLKMKAIYKDAFYLTMLGIKRNLLILLSLLSLTALYVSVFFLIGLFDLNFAIFISLLALPFIPLGMYGLAVSIGTWPVIMQYMVEPYEKEHKTTDENDKEEVIFTDMGKRK